jgi:hypothetical protein
MKIVKKLDNFLNEAKQRRLTQPVIKRINKEIHKFVKDTYYKSIPLGDIFDACRKFGVVVLQEDQTQWSGFLLGGTKKTEQVHFDLGWLDSRDADGRYEVIPNAMLNLSYYKMPQSGNFEVLAYVS